MIAALVAATTCELHAVPSHTEIQISELSVITAKAMRSLLGSLAMTLKFASLPAPIPAGAANDCCALQLAPSQVR